MARKAKEEFAQKTVVLPDNEPAVLDAGQIYIHPVLGPVRCEKLVNEYKGLNPIPSSILLELYPEAGAEAKRISVPQIEVKGSHIRYPSTVKEIAETFRRLSKPEDIRVWAERPNCGQMLLSANPQQWADLIGRTLGEDPSIFPPATRPRDMDRQFGERAMGLLARECALVMKYDLSAAMAMARDSLRARAENRASGTQNAHPTSRP